MGVRRMKRVNGPLPPNFNEHAYLDANPDVAAAVRAGTIANGADHFRQHGFRERRMLSKTVRAAPLKRPFGLDTLPNRRDYILSDIDLATMEGMEIGALASPLVHRDEGRIFYVDHADTATLKQKYAADPHVDTDLIVDVDAVWGANALRDCLGSGRILDYVVASHVIEHVPDLVTWLAEIAEILKPSGTLRLAVPDRRYTFDILRHETRLHDVLEAHLRRARAPSPRMILEHHNLVRQVDCNAAWDGTLDLTALKTASNVENAIRMARDAIANGTYHDVHCWVFTPASFVELCIELQALGILGFKLEKLTPTPHNQLEFFVSLSRCADMDVALASWKAALVT